jgi:hypothetical protein
MRPIFGLALFIVVAFGVTSASAQMSNDNPMVGGAAMFKTKNIVENALNSKDHTYARWLQVKAAGLVDTINGAGTVYRFLHG